MGNNKFQRLNSQASMLIQFARQSNLFDPYLRGFLNGLITMVNLYQNNYILILFLKMMLYIRN